MNGSLNTLGRPVTAAFYLPQFHAIPENDEWWGEGFTEWTNVRKARSMFPGHDVPAIPVGPFGEYNLLDDAVVTWQCETARAYDIDAFIYYHYWFDGKRLLEQPIDHFLRSPNQLNFAMCWANENWTRRWDGKESQVLLGQRYDNSTPASIFASFVPYLQDTRYLRIEDRAVILVHRADHLPDPQRYATTWRQMAREYGLGELLLVASETFPLSDAHLLGFDAVAEFPPVGDSVLSTAARRLPASTNRAFKGRLNSYPALRDRYVRKMADGNRDAFPCVTPRWDNSARRGISATLFYGSTPDLYAVWLAEARRYEQNRRGASGLVLINAWNEWAEGAYLEPDATWGTAYLEASRWDYAVPRPGVKSKPLRGPINIRGLCLGAAASFRSLWRGVRSALQRYTS